MTHTHHKKSKKTALCAVNAKYVHTNLAVRSIKKYCETQNSEFDITICETTINDSMSAYLASLYKLDADIYCFSCYLWNIDKILLLADNLKKAFSGEKDIKVVLGGPEVSYDSADVMKKYPFVDCIIYGEGEITAFELLSGTDMKDIDGITYRENDNIVQNLPRKLPGDLNYLPFAYDEEIEQYKNKIIYYESSRGCPFACTYCLSGDESRVRYLSYERVKSDLMFFIKHKVPLVKFVDRTFNASRKRTRDIFKFIIENAGETRFHTELAGDLIDDELIDVLRTAPDGLFQFEIGVQTTNVKTTDAINRAIEWKPLKENIQKLMSLGTIHIHLDLIAGLPYEDFESFKKSFNDVMELKPHMLQLGFLKLLKGSHIRHNAYEYGMVFKTDAPYEIIKNKYLSFDNLLSLKNTEYVLDKYYNSGAFKKTMNYLFKRYGNDYYKVFFDIAAYFDKMCIFNKSLAKYQLYDILYECFKHFGIDFKECMLYDYLYNVKSHALPDWCSTRQSRSELDAYYNLLKNEELKKKIMPHYYNVPAKKIIKNVHFEKFTYGTLMFDYKTNQVIDVTDYIIQEENNE